MVWADHLTDTADILNVSVEDGEVRYDLGDVRDDKGIAQQCAPWFIDGFVSMPNLPENGECARALYLVDGNEKLVLATADARYADKVGELEAGDRAILSAGAQRLLMKQGNESVTLYTEKADGTPIMMTCSGEDGIASIFVGGTYMEITEDSITLGVKGGGWITLNSEGVQLGGKTFAANTKGGTLGYDTTNPKPVNAIVTFGAGVGAHVPSTHWFVQSPTP